jgi:integrase
MPKVKITKTFVENTPYADKGQTLYCDTELAGFYVVVGMRAKTYIVQKDVQGRTVRCTIGRHGHFTTDEARRIAKDKLYLMAQGINPNQLAEEEKRQVITLRDVLKSYQFTRKNLKETTKNDYEYHLNKYLPDWMGKRMVDITKEMIVARHATLGKTNGEASANGVMRILRAMFSHAHATYDICEVNPVSYLSKIKAWYPERRRSTYIKAHQLKTWWGGVRSLDNDTLRDFLTFLLFTGLRRSEAASLRWADIDFVDRTFTIQKTKNGDPLILPMGEYIYSMFERRRKQYHNQEFVFPGPGKHGHLAEPKTGIYRVIQNCGISFTCHDLRRTFITIAESLDLSHYAIKRLVNHRMTSDVTSGYIIFNPERLRGAVERIEKFILEQVDDPI